MQVVQSHFYTGRGKKKNNKKGTKLSLAVIAACTVKRKREDKNVLNAVDVTQSLLANVLPYFFFSSFKGHDCTYTRKANEHLRCKMLKSTGINTFSFREEKKKKS